MLSLISDRIAILGLISGIERMPCAWYGVQGCHPRPYTGQDAYSEPYIGQGARPGPYILNIISILVLI